MTQQGGALTKIKIAPAIMDADLTRLGEAVAQVQEAGADQLHVDIMDGHFVPSLVGGTRVVAALKRCATIPVDVHLMVSNPQEAVGWFLNAGADIVFFHHDATSDPGATCVPAWRCSAAGCASASRRATSSSGRRS